MTRTFKTALRDASEKKKNFFRQSLPYQLIQIMRCLSFSQSHLYFS